MGQSTNVLEKNRNCVSSLASTPRLGGFFLTECSENLTAPSRLVSGLVRIFLYLFPNIKMGEWPVTLFSQKGERKKDYDALLGGDPSGPKPDESVLELTSNMFFVDEAHKENLRQLEASVANIKTARAELAQERDALARQQSELDSSNAEMSGALQRLQDNADKLEAREQELEVLRQSFDEDNNRLRDQFYALRNREEQLDGLFTELRQQADALDTQRLKLRQHSQSQQTDINREQELFARQQELSELQSRSMFQAEQLSTVQQNYARQKDELRRTTKALKETRRRLDENWELLSEAETIRLAQDKTLNQKIWEISDLTSELETTRNALGSAEFKASAAEDKLLIAKVRLTKRAKKDASRKSMASELKELRGTLTDSRARMEKAFAENRHLKESLAATQERLVSVKQSEESTFAENRRLADDLAKSRQNATQLESRQTHMTTTLKQVRSKLISMQRQEDSTQSENALLTAQNRALQNRQSELNAELQHAQTHEAEFHKLQNALENAKQRERALTRRLNDAQSDLAMMEKVASIQKDKLSGKGDIKIPSFRSLLGS